MTPLVFLDTETTGLHPGRQVWEVGMIRRDDDGERELQFFVDVDLSNADPFGLSVGRFYQRHPFGRYLAGGRGDPTVKFGRDCSDTEAKGDLVHGSLAAEIVTRWTHGAHVVGAVPSFDTISLDALLRKHQHIPAWHYHLVDVENLAVGALARERKTLGSMALLDRVSEDDEELLDRRGEIEQALTLPWDSRKLSAALGLPPQPEDEQHTALGDARWAKALYDTVMSR